jgi:hypothetical protein
MLFALPAVRNTQPGSPPIGITMDVVGFFWNLGLVTVAALVLLYRYSFQDSKLYVPLQRGRTFTNYGNNGNNGNNGGNAVLNEGSMARHQNSFYRKDLKGALELQPMKSFVASPTEFTTPYTNFKQKSVGNGFSEISLHSSSRKLEKSEKSMESNIIGSIKRKLSDFSNKKVNKDDVESTSLLNKE